ncbi:hypothetical protein [Mesorhizobium sp.]|uniref:hypothetical protein n=1 Tax=Mesorhizobium sp. TaxID=1871066 RepID=UPI000FE4A597|nr:hypothetical protein [Mesorhizobium sp.]RWG45226.1 MAG: hypothetical protein EOQ62_18240 [Mesorhizobium sp.]RWI28847.1 MAG: hypothetical protein EOQ92_06355 [Mesorhizobium sp.]RWK48714.1 MAG: hypothetical protein EOR47_16660 [Mesorhizobium sp.]RWK97939.1 MAG: hypothetical protein EOR53_03825 [Mesorhizobium sp.]TIP61201.1 MAG: hypothetical protein E5X56_02195 [Mesorhizobium sp.]
MKILGTMLAMSMAMTGCIGVAAADPWKDESGHGRWMGRYEQGGDYRRTHRYYREHRYGRRAYKEEYRRGRCKIERKWEEDEYKEEIKCKRGWRRPAYVYRY